MGSSLRTGLRAGLLVTLAAAGVTTLSACGDAGSRDANLVSGKQLFVEKCGSCHILNRAGTKGTAGPNLDESFQQALRDGLPRTGIRGVIHGQILHPGDFEHEDGKRSDNSSAMPANLVTGDDALDVSAYVASVVARRGKDSGLLATAVKAAGGGPPVQAKGGVLSIPADPGGQLAYVSDRANAEAGELTVRAPNESSTPHDIVIDDKGKGEVVQNGGVSEFEADFAPDEYTYYCSVPGHREAGMEGTLTVK
jgi:mono/diheme cytochrome c family protein